MLNGEIALVSGASRGIGAAIAERLAADGARVIGTATTAEGAARITENLEQSRRPRRGAQRDQPGIDRCAESRTSRARKARSVSFATMPGITRDTLLLRMKLDDWDAVIQTNLASVFRLSKAVLRGMMKARKGRIISITSVVGLTGNPGQANYAAAKAGILGFTKSLAREVGSRGITVNAIAPGFIDTDMTRALNPRPAGGVERPNSPRKTGPAGGYCRGGGVFMLGRRGLYHGRDAARERRHVHAVSVFGPLLASVLSRRP